MKEEKYKSILLNASLNDFADFDEETIKLMIDKTEANLGYSLSGYIKADKPYNQFYSPSIIGKIYPNKKIASIILEELSKNEENVGIICGREITRKEIKRNILIAADALKEHGIKKNDIITLCVPSTPDAIYYFLAANLIGAICRPIDPISSKSTTRANLEVTNSKLLITLDLNYKKFKGITNGLDCKVVGLSLNDTFPFGFNFKKIGIKSLGTITGKQIKNDDDWISSKDFIKESKEKELNVADLESEYNENDLYCIFSSSGTSGKPKGINSANYSMVNSVLKQIDVNYRRKPGDIIFNPNPSYSSYFWNDIYYALVADIPVRLSPLFSVEKSIEEIKESGCSIVLCGPIILERWNQYIEKEISKGRVPDFSHINHIFSGGDLLRISLEKRTNDNLQKCGCTAKVENGYGTSETEGPAVVPNGATVNTDAYCEGSVGTPFPDSGICIFEYDIENACRNIEKADYDKGLQYFQIGEICLNTNNPEIFMEYYNDPQATSVAKITHSDGSEWYHTGDLGFMDPAGHLFCTGRKYGMIVRSGHKIWTSKINSVVRKYDEVADCETIGMEDSLEQEIPVLFISFIEGLTEDKKTKLLEKIKKDLEKEYDELHIPKYIKELPKIPRNLMLKAKLKELKQLAQEMINKQNLEFTQEENRKLLNLLKRIIKN